MGQLDDIAELFEGIDGQVEFRKRVEAVTTWLESRPGVSTARLVCRDQIPLGAADGDVPRIAGAQFSLLPREIAIVNGKSPIPKHLFPESASMPVTVYTPFTDRNGEVAGAILVKASSPKSFVKKHSAELRILASKARDLVDIASLRAAEPPSASGGDLTPMVIGKLMDLVKLPAYVLSTSGEFLFVNEYFLDQFAYADLEELNTRPEVFIRQSDWSDQLRRLTSDSGFTPLVTKIRTGNDRVRSVYDYSLLMGKDIFGVLVDVSDFVQMNERLQDALEGQTRLNEQLSAATGMLQKTQATAMKSLAKLAEYRDKETGGHLQRICEYMKLVAIEINREQPYSFHVANDYADDIYLSGMLHDIGKVGVPDRILLKPGRLDPDEFELMKQHTVIGGQTLDAVARAYPDAEFLRMARDIAWTHHEKYDGSGYPNGLKGEEIPLCGRIVAVADVYDALTTRRVYKEAFSHEKARSILVEARGKHFDPDILDVFLELEDEFRGVASRFDSDASQAKEYNETEVLAGV